MAYITHWTCIGCEETHHSVRPRSDMCFNCKAETNKEKHNEYFEAIDALTMEERVRKLEEFVYSHSHSREGRY